MGFEGGSFGPGEFSDLAVISLKVATRIHGNTTIRRCPQGSVAQSKELLSELQSLCFI